MGSVELATRRLRLRPLATGDLEPLALAHADPEVMAWFAAPLDRAETAAFIARSETHWSANGFGFWTIRDREDEAFLGLVSLLRVRFEATFTPAVEIGWRLPRAAWGRGIATEAAGAALDHGFGALGLDRIVAFAVPGNRRSRAVMERLAMSHVPEEDFEHPALPAGHPFRRHVFYRLDARTWRHRPSGAATPSQASSGQALA